MAAAKPLNVDGVVEADGAFGSEANELSVLRLMQWQRLQLLAAPSQYQYQLQLVIVSKLKPTPSLKLCLCPTSQLQLEPSLWGSRRRNTRRRKSSKHLAIFIAASLCINEWQFEIDSRSESGARKSQLEHIRASLMFQLLN